MMQEKLKLLILTDYSFPLRPRLFPRRPSNNIACMTDLKSVLFRNQATCQISSECVQLFRREKMTDRQSYFKILVGMDNNWITAITFDFNHTIWYFYNTVKQLEISTDCQE